MAEASTVPSMATCCRLSDATLAAVIPVGVVGALERPASQPKRVQSCAGAVRQTAHAVTSPASASALRLASPIPDICTFPACAGGRIFTLSLTKRHRMTATHARQITAVLVVGRSEEHTSELQSLAYLVCRLLLEKKKKKKIYHKIENI